MMSALCSPPLCPLLSTEREQKREERTRQKAKEGRERERQVCVTNNEGKRKKKQTERGLSKVKSTKFDHGSSSRCYAVAVADFSLSHRWAHTLVDGWRLLAVFFCLVSFHVPWLENASIVSSSLCLFIYFVCLLMLMFFQALVFIVDAIAVLWWLSHRSTSNSCF